MAKNTASVRGSAHTSRAQESRENNAVHDEDHIEFEPSGPLPEIPARPGYAQRWVRVRKGQEDDARNLYKATRQGWKPRAAETVGKAFQWLTVKREGIGGVIGTHDMVLMERHVEVQKKAERHLKDTRRGLEKAVKQNLFNEHRELGGAATGLTAPSFESSAQVERGRPVEADDD